MAVSIITKINMYFIFIWIFHLLTGIECFFQQFNILINCWDKNIYLWQIFFFHVGSMQLYAVIIIHIIKMYCHFQ